MDGCPNLKELNLTSCRGVPRGFKQLHNECSISRLRGQFHVHPAQIDLAEAE